MAYDEGVAERIREVFDGRHDIVEKKMFGGIAFMHNGNMCCGYATSGMDRAVRSIQWIVASEIGLNVWNARP